MSAPPRRRETLARSLGVGVPRRHRCPPADPPSVRQSPSKQGAPTGLHHNRDLRALRCPREPHAHTMVGSWLWKRSRLFAIWPWSARRRLHTALADEGRGHELENDSGIFSPRALAVVRLTTRSNLVGCSTGMSPGFAPRRILSTKSAARRNRSGMFHRTSNRGLPSTNLCSVPPSRSRKNWPRCRQAALRRVLAGSLHRFARLKKSPDGHLAQLPHFARQSLFVSMGWVFC